MSETSRGRETGRQAEALAAADTRGTRRRGRPGWAVAGLVAVLAAGGAAAWRAGVFSPAASSGSGQQGVPVTPGIFDDANGLVQVTGALTPGQHVVVPAS